MAESEEKATPKVDTQGGANIQGPVHVNKGDFVGRDKIFQIGALTIPFWLASTIGITLVIATVGLIGIAGGAWGIVSQLAATPTATPKPPLQTMTGDFRIIVAQFGEKDAEGKLHPSELGNEISAWLARRLNQELTNAEAQTNLGTVTLWHDSLNKPATNPAIGLIASSEQAERLAREWKAMMVIYAVLAPVADNNSARDLQLDFYYAVQKVRDEPDVAIGHHPFGAALAIAFEDDPILAREKLESNPDLLQRTKALVWLTKALTKEVIDEPVDALAIYQEGERSLAAWENPAARAVFYYFMGRTALLLKDLAEAERAFTQALVDDPNNIKAHIGLGNYYYTQAQLYAVRQQPLAIELNQCTLAATDVNTVAATSGKVPTSFAQAQAALLSAQAEYQRAITLANQPLAQSPASQAVARLMLGSTDRLLGELLVIECGDCATNAESTVALRQQATAVLHQAEESYRQSIETFQRTQKYDFLTFTYQGLGATQRALGHLQQLQADPKAAAASFQQAIQFYQACLGNEARSSGEQESEFQQRIKCYCRTYEQEVQKSYIGLGGGDG